MAPQEPARPSVLGLLRTGPTPASSGDFKSLTVAHSYCLSYRVIGSELVQKYVGEGARMVRELFEMAR